MARLGFLGLGIMGYPMARNLLNSGHQVALWSHSAAKAQQLAREAGGVACEQPRQVGEFAECVFLCVGDTAMSERVILGPGGVAEGARPGTVVADASTISPSRSCAIAESLAAKGVHHLDAPCTGSRIGAENGALTFMVGGDREVFEKARPWFEPMGKQLYYCGGAGLGLHAKLTQNLILSNLLQAFNEGMVLSTKAGVAPRVMLEILNNSAARSGLIAAKAPLVFSRNFATNFSIKWMHKDVGLMLASGEEMEVPLPLTAVTQQMLRAALAEGYGEEDMCASIKVMESWAGVEVKQT